MLRRLVSLAGKLFSYMIHDHTPAKIMGMHSAWIDREEQEDQFNELRDQVEFTWRFKTMGEMAEEAEKEFQGGG